MNFDARIARARTGDPAALEAILAEQLPAIRAFVRLKAGPAVLDRESASDVAQSVGLEILNSLDSFREGGEEGFRRWWHTLAIRKLADRQRRMLAAQRDVRREIAVDDAPSAWQEACVTFGTPSGDAIGNEVQHRLDRAFATLSPEQQDIVLMSRFLGLSHREIADQVGKSEAATRKALSRALLALADAVGSGDA